MWERIFHHLESRTILLTEQEKSILQSVLVQKKFRKGQFILQEGDPAKVESFVTKGLTRTYEIDEKGQEHVLFFGPEDWWVGDTYSFLTGTASSCNVDCLENTEVLQIDKIRLEWLYEQIPVLNKYYRLLFQQAFISATQRISDSLSKSALERYQDFKARYPTLEQRVSNYQIASYLGITPQSLSRIRRQENPQRKNRKLP